MRSDALDRVLKAAAVGMKPATNGQSQPAAPEPAPVAVAAPPTPAKPARRAEPKPVAQPAARPEIPSVQRVMEALAQPQDDRYGLAVSAVPEVEPTAYLSVRIPKQMRATVRAFCAQHDLTLQDLMVYLLADFLGKQGASA